MIDPKIHPQHRVLLLCQILLPLGPAPDSLAAMALVGVLPARKQLPVNILGDIKTPIGKLGALVVVAVLVCEDGLEGGHVNLVAYRELVNRVLD